MLNCAPELARGWKMDAGVRQQDGASKAQADAPLRFRFRLHAGYKRLQPAYAADMGLKRFTRRVPPQWEL
jgi:hypothetical protein